MQIGRNEKGWKAWFDTDAPEDSPIPDGYENSLDTFRKLLLIRYVKFDDKEMGILIVHHNLAGRGVQIACSLRLASTYLSPWV